MHNNCEDGLLIVASNPFAIINQVSVLLSADQTRPDRSEFQALRVTDRKMGLKATLITAMATAYVEPVMFLYMICLYYLIPAVNSLYLFKVIH